MDIRDHITQETVQEFISALPRMDVAFSDLQDDVDRHAQLEKLVEPLTDDQVVAYVFWLAGKVGI